ncbi:MAG: hypothetical protein KatS3mg073_0106 [Meiothermus sp.]|nr:MAG: hypothetical protein KatS3mg073_0106 [Meiothermus sp.]
MLRTTRVGMERLRGWLSCRLRGFSLCNLMPWMAVLLLGWVVYSR